MISPAVHELVNAVRAEIEDTPYALTETSQGFDVALDLADASYYSLFAKEKLSKTWIYHVKIEDADAKVLSITDEVRVVTWEAGARSRDGQLVPRLAGSASGAKGRFNVKSFETTYAITEDGTYDKVIDYRFDSAEGRKLVRGPAERLDWTEQRGAAERLGLIVGVGTAVLLVLGGIVALVLFLTLR